MIRARGLLGRTARPSTLRTSAVHFPTYHYTIPIIPCEQANRTFSSRPVPTNRLQNRRTLLLKRSGEAEELTEEEKEHLMTDILSLQTPEYSRVKIGDIIAKEYMPPASHTAWVRMASVHCMAAIPLSWRCFQGEGRLLGSPYTSWTAGWFPHVSGKKNGEKEGEAAAGAAEEVDMPLALTINRFTGLLAKDSPVCAAAGGSSERLIRALTSLHMLRHSPQRTPAEDDDKADATEEDKVKPCIHSSWQDEVGGESASQKCDIYGLEYTLHPAEDNNGAPEAGVTASVTFIVNKASGVVHEVTIRCPQHLWKKLSDQEGKGSRQLRRSAVLYGHRSAAAESDKHVGLGLGAAHSFTLQGLLNSVTIQE